MKPRIGYLSWSYAYCLWYLLLSLALARISARLADSPVKSSKLAFRNEPVEGSGSFGGNVSHDEQEWHASGLSPDDEPGDDGDEDEDEHHEGSGDVIEGSGAVQHIAPKSQDLPLTTVQSSPTMARTHFISESFTSTMQPTAVNPSSNPSSTTPTTAAVNPLLHYTATTTTTTRTVTTTTRKPVVVNTRLPPQTETSYISEMEQPFEMLKPGILAAVSGGAVVGVLLTILLIMFIIYRMRKKDEGSYSLDEPHQPPNYSYAYQKASTKEFYA